MLQRDTQAAWIRALTLTAPYARGGGTCLPDLVAIPAALYPARTALIDERQSLTYAELAGLMNRAARWALAHGVAPGDVVGLMLPNSAAYVAIWLGIISVRGVVALINPALSGQGLEAAVAAVRPRHVIADENYMRALDAFSPAPLNAEECRPPQPGDVALLIYTSGTTGLPKAARISHRRVAEWSLWFAGLIDTGPDDRMYNCLPLFHSVGGVVAVGAMLASGGSVLIRARFSASRFWGDVIGHRCTLFQYIGELCRHLLSAADNGAHAGHTLRLACGNGLRGDVWEPFAARFGVPRILEFYASTEGNVSLYNVPGRPGAIGHIPGFLAHRSAVALAMVDVESGVLLRDADGRVGLCQADDVGEALGRIATRAFEGYTDLAASASKIARDVFAPGDAWYRTGDLMRRDAEGFFYFVDRLGDNYRWKGENVATEWVERVVRDAPGVCRAIVYGVTVPGQDGRAGMAALVVDADFAPDKLYAHVARHLPAYAWPVFLRIVVEIPDTATFKPQRAAFVRDGIAAADYVHQRGVGYVVRKEGLLF